MTKSLRVQDEVLVYLTAIGLSTFEIEREMGYPAEEIRIKLTDDRLKDKVIRLKKKLEAHDDDTKGRFEKILPAAIDALEQILFDINAKPQIKIQAAQDVIDRVLGKPKQTIDHEGSLVRAYLERLNREEVKEAIVVPYVEVENPNQLPLPKSFNPNTQEDAVDSWISRNLR